MINEFTRASTIEEAVDLGRKGFIYLAGVTQINNASRRKWGPPVEKVVSLDALDLSAISIDDTEVVVIGSGSTLQEIADSDIAPPALATAAGFIPTRSVRNIATIGGNIGANRPDSYIIPTLIALEASVELADKSRMRVEEYVFENHNELITYIRIPKCVGSCIAVKESRSQLALPVVTAAVGITTHPDNSIANVIVAVGVVAPHVVRLPGVERGIIDATLLKNLVIDGSTTGNREFGGPAPDANAPGRIEHAIAAEISPRADFLGSVNYKRYINSVIIADALRHCIAECGI